MQDRESLYRREAADFYKRLRQEVVRGNDCLTADENRALQAHYPIMMNSRRYPATLAETIYASRRRHAVAAIRDTEMPVVLDAGCGFGSESFLFAMLGARVIALDVSAEQIAIAEKRKPYYEACLEKPLAIDFVVADLNRYVPQNTNLSLTWLASVLPIVRDKLGFMRRIRSATRPQGKVLVTDLNLANPMFQLAEWRRGHLGDGRLAWLKPMFDTFSRRPFNGARYPVSRDNVDGYSCFFNPRGLSRLLTSAEFKISLVDCAGFAPPQLFGDIAASAEAWIGGLPWINRFGYFYTVGAEK